MRAILKRMNTADEFEIISFGDDVRSLLSSAFSERTCFL